MKLQSKIIATVIGVYVITILSLYLFSINNYVRTLEQLEKDMMQKNLERVDKTLKKEQLGLNRVAKDWACWDETYNFVCHPNHEFIERNLKIDDFVNLKINFLVIADDKNRIIVAKYFDMQHKKFVEKERLLDNIWQNYNQISDVHEGSWTIIENQIAMISCEPIFKSDKDGPSKGRLLFGRILDQEYTKELSTNLEMNIKIQPITIGKIIDGGIVVSSDHLLFGQRIIKDEDSGKELGVFSVNQPRNMYTTVMRIITYNIFIYVLAGIIICVLLIIILRKIFLKRLLLLGNKMEQIAKTQKIDTGPLLDSNDEVAGLTANFNNMLKSIQNHQQQLELAKYEAETANKAKSTFLANMTHEIRTPLTAIIGMTDLMRATNIDEEQKEYVRIIAQSSQQLMANINDILDLSKIEAKMLELENGQFALDECIETSVDMVANEVNKKNLRLDCYMSSNTPKIFEGDGKRLCQVLTNFLSNAVKFTEKGNVVLSVEKKGDELAFRIADTGIGIKKEALNKLFAPFTQADNSITRKYGGTGLGLAINKSMIELMGGRVEVQSEAGEGTVFDFYLPNSGEGDDIEGDDHEYCHFVDKRILLIDDNEKSAEIMKRQLNDWGIEMIASSCHQEIRTILEQDNWHGIIIHTSMEKKLRIDELAGNLPIILVLNQFQKEKDGRMKLQYPIRTRLLRKALCDIFEKGNEKIEELEVISDNIKIEKNVSVLLVDDHLINQKFVLTILKKVGMNKIDVANDGKEACKKFLEKKYDLVLMDCVMPVMNGIEAIKIIRDSPNGKETKIFALTANTIEEDRRECLEAGADEFLTKPFKKSEFLKLIHKYFC